MEKRTKNSPPKVGGVAESRGGMYAQRSCPMWAKNNIGVSYPSTQGSPSPKLGEELKRPAPIVWPEKFLPPEVAEEVRFVPLKKTSVLPLYVSQDGRGFSCSAVKDQETGEVRGFTLRAIKDNQCPTTDPKRKCSSGNYYREFTQKRISVHRAVLLAWVGPCPEGYECDHLNGNNVDNRLCNLQWVTRLENMKRRVILKRLRNLHKAYPELYKDPAKMTRQELLDLFAQG